VTTSCDDSAMTTSWRANVSRAVQDDLDELFGTALGLAEHLLSKNGEFFPFAVTLPASGGRADLAQVLDDSLGEHPNSVDVLESLYSAIGMRRVEFIGAAFVADVRLTSGSAVRIQAEHAQGPALEIVVPYRRNRLRRAVIFDEMSTAAGDRHLWEAVD
jgi:hypothetical protein